jgi:hypothetical protein
MNQNSERNSREKLLAKKHMENSRKRHMKAHRFNIIPSEPHGGEMAPAELPLNYISPAFKFLSNIHHMIPALAIILAPFLLGLRAISAVASGYGRRL